MSPVEEGGFAEIETIEDHHWLPQWNGLIAGAIDAHSTELISDTHVPVKDIRRLCPGFFDASKSDKKVFWALFFASIARYESGFDANARYRESWKDPDTGKPQYSEGLLQLSYSDRHGHPDCLLNRKTANIYDPETNLSCGVAIMRKQLHQRKSLFPGKMYYWSVLTNRKYQKKVIEFFKRHSDRLGFCSADIALAE